MHETFPLTLWGLKQMLSHPHTLLERMAENQVFYEFSESEKRFLVSWLDPSSIIIERQRRILLEAIKHICEMTPFLLGQVCHACGENELDEHERTGKPICFDCFLEGRQIPKFIERACWFN